MLHQDYSLLHELAKTLADTQNDYIPEPDYAASSHIYHLIHQLCHLLTDLLPEALGENTFPGMHPSVCVCVCTQSYVHEICLCG